MRMFEIFDRNILNIWWESLNADYPANNIMGRIWLAYFVGKFGGNNQTILWEYFKYLVGMIKIFDGNILNIWWECRYLAHNVMGRTRLAYLVGIIKISDSHILNIWWE